MTLFSLQEPPEVSLLISGPLDDTLYLQNTHFVSSDSINVAEDWPGDTKGCQRWGHSPFSGQKVRFQIEGVKWGADTHTVSGTRPLGFFPSLFSAVLFQPSILKSQLNCWNVKSQTREGQIRKPPAWLGCTRGMGLWTLVRKRGSSQSMQLVRICPSCWSCAFWKRV